MSAALDILHTIIFNPGFLTVIKALFYTSPIWITVGLALIAWNMWVTYVRAKFINSQTYILLEVRLPKDVFKSPQAMEFLFNTMHSTGGEGGFKFKWFPPKLESDSYIKGSVRPWYSLELCAIDGKVRFFIWSRVGNRATIEAQLYSQFPGIEIFEVPDYTLPIAYDTTKYSFWASEFELTKADPFPIKTYIDYGMDRDPKEEYKIDPLTPLIEFLGALPPSQTVWIQIGITAHKAEDYDKASGKMVDNKWAKGAETEIQKILDKAKPPKPKEGEQPTSAPRSLTEGEKDTIQALERSVSKRGFDTLIRAIYFAPKESFNQGNVGGIMAGLTHFNSNNLNGFKPAGAMPTDELKSRALYAYKNRGFFWNEFKRKTFVLNTEELATIWHFPSGGAVTPGVPRVESRKSEAPANLPV